jgi:hypothetical protein
MIAERAYRVEETAELRFPLLLGKARYQRVHLLVHGLIVAGQKGYRRLVHLIVSLSVFSIPPKQAASNRQFNV